jgi:hypothetical protein
MMMVTVAPDTCILTLHSCYTQTMSKRLQVLIPEKEMEELKRLARREKMPLGEWVRKALREVRSKQPSGEPEVKLQAVRRAAKYCFPTGDVEQMLDEIERGYQE